MELGIQKLLLSDIFIDPTWNARTNLDEGENELEGTEGLQGLALGWTTSAAEQVAEWATGARVVKAFNTTGAGNMLDPDYDGQVATLFVCGDADEAKQVVTELAKWAAD
jgi:predicted dinucleotide-binding enzyme